MTTETQTQAAAEPSDAEREAFFREISEKRTAGVTPPVDESPPEDPAEPPVQSEPAAPPAPVAAPAAKPAPEPTAAAVTDIDSMTPDQLKAHARKMEHERQAAVGRASALQRERDRQRPVVAAPPSQALPETERLATAFPELNQAVAHEIEQRTRAVQEETQRRIAQANVETLSAIHPGWFPTMQSDEFSYWLSQQPAAEQQKFESNSVADYAHLLTSFKAASASSPTTAPAGPTEADRLAAERAQRAQQRLSVPVGRNSAGNRTTSEPDPETDPEGYFNALAARRDLKRETRPR